MENEATGFAYTIKRSEVVPEHPIVDVAVSETLYAPGVLKVWLKVEEDDVYPLPTVHEYCMLPPTFVEAVNCAGLPAHALAMEILTVGCENAATVSLYLA